MITFVTSYSSHQKVFADIITKVLAEYAESQSCGFVKVSFPEYPVFSFPVYCWNKVLALKEVFDRADEGDWVVWCDADVLVQNPSLDINHYFSLVGHPILVSQDWHGICTGVIAIRKSDITTRVLTAWAGLRDISMVADATDQIAFEYLTKMYQDIFDLIEVLPFSFCGILTNSEPANEFLFHLEGNKHTQRRLHWLKQKGLYVD